MSIGSFGVLAASFVATFAFALLYQVPRRAFIQVGVIGLAAWATLDAALSHGATVAGASFAAAFVVGFLSELCARLFRLPVTVFSVAGMVNLVPGTSAYAAIRLFVMGDYTGGIGKATITLLAAVAIAGGLITATTLMRLGKKSSSRLKRAGG